jgi:hypothetical protein
MQVSRNGPVFTTYDSHLSLKITSAGIHSSDHMIVDSVQHQYLRLYICVQQLRQIQQSPVGVSRRSFYRINSTGNQDLHFQRNTVCDRGLG